MHETPSVNTTNQIFHTLPTVVYCGAIRLTAKVYSKDENIAFPTVKEPP